MSLLRSTSRLLIPDQTGLRAIEEAVADWRQARESAGHAGQRILADLQGVVSLIRIFAMVTAAQFGDRGVWVPMAWAISGAAAVGVASTLPFLISARMPGSVGDLVILAVLIVPVSVAVLFPIVAAIGLGVDRERATPLAGQIVIAIVFAVILTGWVAPAANRAYVLKAAQMLGQTRVVTGQAEASLGTLVTDLKSERAATASGAARQLRTRAALSLGAPTFLVLGFAVRRRWIRGDSWRTAQLAAGGAAAAAIVFGLVVTSVLPPSWSSRMLSDWVTGWTGTRPWFALIGAWTITALALRTRRDAPSTQH